MTMVAMKRADITPNTYIHNADHLYLITAVRAQGGRITIRLTDENDPLTSERLPLPDQPGSAGRSLLLEPEIHEEPLHVVMRDYDLVCHGPDERDTASVEEWGKGQCA